ncbi:MAG: hypothetical protein WAU88_09200 [Candidatus Zixiibacteriota bacterium]
MHDVLIVAIVFGTVLMIIRSAMEHNYRLRVLQKMQSVDPDALKVSASMYSESQSIKWGLILVAVGAVILFVEFGSFDLRGDAVFGLISIAAGVAMLLHYAIANWRQKNLKQHGAAL